MKIQTKQLGSVWVACIPELGISAIGRTETDARQAVQHALDTHQLKHTK